MQLIETSKLLVPGEYKMLGYIKPEKSQLKIIEYEVYNGYYCGVCKSISRRYGQLPRISLSYDAAFLALLLAALDDDKDDPSYEHCIIHHIRKKIVISNSAVDHAADIMLILAWHKLADDADDENSLFAKTVMKLLGRIYDRLRINNIILCENIEAHLRTLRALEIKRCADLDEAAEPFACIMQEIFTSYKEISDNSDIKQILSNLGYHLGKWVYLLDAYDDVEEDLENNSYNPLFFRYDLTAEESPVDFKARIRNACQRSLSIYMNETGKALDLLDIKKNKGILENIIFMGLLRQSETLLLKDDSLRYKPKEYIEK